MESLGLLVQFVSKRSSLLLAAVADLCVCLLCVHSFIQG